ncbi:hypothetical protein FORC17_p022 (plasmid) [Vibrio vulnificus]|nr:hypothetical protein FORC17_p022 [Vibrio vulnificus]
MAAWQRKRISDSRNSRLFPKENVPCSDERQATPSSYLIFTFNTSNCNTVTKRYFSTSKTSQRGI